MASLWNNDYIINDSKAFGGEHNVEEDNDVDACDGSKDRLLSFRFCFGRLRWKRLQHGDRMLDDAETASDWWGGGGHTEEGGGSTIKELILER